jgi:hypothetical protein
VTGGGMTSLSKNQIKYSKYRWEFLRRNKDYIAEWEKLQKFLKDVGINPPDGSMSELEIDFCDKWKISNLLNPYVNYEEYINLSYIPDRDWLEHFNTPTTNDALSNYGVDVHRLMFECLFPAYQHGRPIVVEDGWDINFDDTVFHKSISNHFAERGILRITIDFNYSKRRILQELKSLIDEWKIFYKHSQRKLLFKKFCKDKNIHKFPISEQSKKEFEKAYKKSLKEIQKKYKQKKLHFGNFDVYLKVYDLREKKISWAKIAKKLGLNSIQTARNHYKAACEIIEKGIDLYVK